jgi:arylsulfatase A-like enzyme
MYPSSKDMNRRDFLRLMGTGAALAIWPGGCSKDELAQWNVSYSGPARHVVLISLDTSRADFFGCYGNPWVETPEIDRLAAESILFTDCMTAVPTTLASHTSLFTGKYPHTHGTPRNGFMVNKRNIMLTEILRKVGFHTAGFLGSFALDSRFGFAQGFDYYNEEFDQLVKDRGADQDQRNAESVTNSAIGYLERIDVPSHLFLFVHYFDPHGPYAPPSSYLEMYDQVDMLNSWLSMLRGGSGDSSAEDGFTARSYAGEISYMDRHVGRMVDYLRKRDILDEAILIIASDHGENCNEHPPDWGHGPTVYQSTMQMVCMIRLPDARKAGTRVKQLFASIDILPTLLKYLGLVIPGGIDGEAIDLHCSEASLSFPRRTRFGEATQPRGRVETDRRWRNRRKARCVREDELKYIQTPYEGTEELYDLSQDPHEQENLLENVTPDVIGKAKALRGKLESWTNSANPLPSRFEPSQRDETIKRLKSLGYLK